jgi:zinc transport system permease protein
MIEIFSYDFMVYALIGAILSGVSCSLLSNYIVLKKMEFIGEGAAHTAFGGIAFAILFGLNLNIITIITGIIFATVVYYLSKKQKIQENSIIGMFLSFSMALGIIFLSIKPGYTPEISSYLFGDVLMINISDLIILTSILIIIILFIILFGRELKYYSYNQKISKIYGVPVNFMHYTFLILISVVVVTSVKIIGAILVTSLLITPGVTARLFAKSINQMLIISTIIGVFSTFTGIIISYYLNIPSGPAIVITIFSLFVILYIFQKVFSYFSNRT